MNEKISIKINKTQPFQTLSVWVKQIIWPTGGTEGGDKINGLPLPSPPASIMLWSANIKTLFHKIGYLQIDGLFTFLTHFCVAFFLFSSIKKTLFITFSKPVLKCLYL